MGKLADFVTCFGAYLILFAVFVIVIAIGAVIGVTLRKNKNKKDELEKLELEKLALEKIAAEKTAADNE